MKIDYARKAISYADSSREADDIPRVYTFLIECNGGNRTIQ